MGLVGAHVHLLGAKEKPSKGEPSKASLYLDFYPLYLLRFAFGTSSYGLSFKTAQTESPILILAPLMLLYIVAEEYGNYYVIGDTAYVTNDALGKENERIREFIIPAEDLVTVEIP